MSELKFEGDKTEDFVPENKLTPERQAELESHLKQCELPFLASCPDCQELYRNIGYKKYKAILEGLPPTESESYI